MEQQLIIVLENQLGFSLDEIYEMVYPQNNTITRSSVYRYLVRNQINTIPKEEKEKAKKFKEYKPSET